MTRLQQRQNSCDCGKTTKESNSFVTKNKTYETRSGVQRKQEAAFNGCHKKICVNNLNLRRKVYLKKMESSLVTLPIRNGHQINGESRVKIIKSPTKICNKNCNKVVSNGAHSLLDTSLEKIITAKINLDILDINDDLLKKEDSTLSNGILTNGYVKTLNENGNEGKLIQDGECMKENSKTLLKDTTSDSDIIKEENIVSNEGNITNGHIDYNNPCSKHSPARKLHKRSRFELFIKETCENLGLGIVDEKRTRKARLSYSPESNRKTKDICQDKTCNQQPLKKKGGRKAKSKLPVLHYLDLYIKNKCDEIKVDSDNKLFFPSVKVESNSVNQETRNNSTSSVAEPIKYTHPEQVSPDTVNNSSKISLSSDQSEVFLSEHKIIKTENQSCNSQLTSTLKKRRKMCRKVTNKKRKIVDRINIDEYDSPIVQVLGHRNGNKVKEMLVLFEDGTSNWIVYDRKMLITDNVCDYYRHEDQDLSVINRLGYHDYTMNDSDNSDSDIYDANETDDSDCDEVFHEKFSSLSRAVNLSKPGEAVFNRLSPNVQCEMSSHSDLNSLCSNVISSKHTKIYPSEMSKDVIVKNDGDFCNIFLKRHVYKNDPQKKDLINLKSCEQLINTLEDCAVNEQCKVVMINGIEDFFASHRTFEKLLKKTVALEGKKYEQDVSTMRYLVQTIRNFNKPTVGVINKTASGLPASLLSLFDMIFHEQSGEVVHTKHKKKLKKKAIKESSNDVSDLLSITENRQKFAFPRLMGLSESNESKVMGEPRKLFKFDEAHDNVPYLNGAPLSNQLLNSVRNMKNNSNLRVNSLRQSQTDISDDDECVEDKNEPVIVQNASNEIDNLEYLRNLENQIEMEREKTQNCMSDLIDYIASLEK